MRKIWAVGATVAAVAAAGVTSLPIAEARDVGAARAFGVADGTLVAGAFADFPYYDGYVYGPLPYGRSYAPGGSYSSQVIRGPRVHRGSRIHVARAGHVARAYHVVRVRHSVRAYVFDPYYGGGPFYQHHSCCRYW